MKKFTILFTILFIVMSINNANAASDEQEYQKYIIDQKRDVDGSQICFFNYYYNNNFYKIKVPCTRQHFLQLDHLFHATELDSSSYYYKLIFFNNMLKKYGLEALYY